eukprot:TRINITY_DN16651_c0_g1_i1.p1 TRINITY_DN16651_c0_g1~~TRINITY_DN16651_c0_g1_i1.p1  ORF type:complete len:257 (-),score=25.61 TRINITY_DN16651_c0_g1_i1:38-724(-)
MYQYKTSKSLPVIPKGGHSHGQGPCCGQTPKSGTTSGTSSARDTPTTTRATTKPPTPSATRQAPYFGTSIILRAEEGQEEEMPDFEVDAVFHSDKIRIPAASLLGRWTIILFYPQNYACSDTLVAYDTYLTALERYNCHIIGASNDMSLSHYSWNARSKESGGGGNVNFPLIGDNKRLFANLFGVEEENGKNALTSIFISPEGKIVKRLKTIEMTQVFSALFGDRQDL